MANRIVERLFSLACLVCLVCLAGFAAAAHAGDGPFGRAYPPSCVPYPLPPVQGPLYQSVPPIAGVAFFRLDCSGGHRALFLVLGGGGMNARRPMPSIVAVQQEQEFPLRAARSPNSITEVVEFFDDTTGEVFVLEPPVAGATLNFDNALVIRVAFGSDEPIVVPIPDYLPPASPPNQPVSRYMTGSWYDPAHPGEGIFLEVGENRDGSAFVLFSWFTYDAAGAPYWLIGQGFLVEGQPNIVAPVRAFRGGRFAGAFDAAQVESAPWGEVEFAFPDCNTMTLRFAGTATAPGAPTGNGTRRWARLVSIKGLACE